MSVFTTHAIRCKQTGEEIATKLDGGDCACSSAAECRLHPAQQKVVPPPPPPTTVRNPGTKLW